MSDERQKARADYDALVPGLVDERNHTLGLLPNSWSNRMSNTAQVEPTEEQRQAAAAFVARHGEQNEVIDSGGQARLEWSPTHTADDIARFLAEREAKLQARIDDLTERSARRLDDSTAIDALVYAIACLELQPGSERDRAVRDALNRVINHVGAIEVRARDSATKVVGTLVAGAKAREDALTARVAELEERERFRDLAAEVDTGEPADSILIRALTERAAQHLADIKALMGFVCFVDEGYDHDEDAHRYGTPCRCCMANHLRHRLAHYDDAKADAPTVDWSWVLR